MRWTRLGQSAITSKVLQGTFTTNQEVEQLVASQCPELHIRTTSLVKIRHLLHNLLSFYWLFLFIIVRNSCV
ncbi:hypothetical protein EV126DRAFT_523561 [Verticillium dahliae]|nr:hypothetical protein EV126DRAFT_523561 [Verticillium dahliae]